MQMLYNSDSFAVVSFDVPVDAGDGALTRGEHLRGGLGREVVERQCEQCEVERAVRCIDGGGVHDTHGGAWFAVQGAGDPGHRFGIDVGDGDLGGRVLVEEQARHRAMAGAELQDLRVGDVGQDVQDTASHLAVVAEDPAGPVQGVDDLTFDAFELVVSRGVTIQVFVPVGLQQPVQAGGVEAATRHVGDIGHGSGAHEIHHGRHFVRVSALAEDLVDLAAGVVDDVEDPLLLIGIGGVRGLRDRTEQLADRLAEVDLRGICALGDLGPRRGLDLLGGGTAGMVGLTERGLQRARGLFPESSVTREAAEASQRDSQAGALVDPDHPGRQQALAGAERCDRACVDGERALRLQRACNPALARGHGIGRC